MRVTAAAVLRFTRSDLCGASRPWAAATAAVVGSPASAPTTTMDGMRAGPDRCPPADVQVCGGGSRAAAA